MLFKEKAVQLTPDEKVVAIHHRHWFVFLLKTVGIVVLFLLPFILLLILNYPVVSSLALATIADGALETPIVVFVGAFWFLIMWMYFFNEWTDYYLDTWVITNKRIIDIEQKGFFHREVSSFRMERIQDVTFEVNGFLATLLDFGTIHVQTAGENLEFIMRDAPHPRKIRDIILKEADIIMDHTSSV